MNNMYTQNRNNIERHVKTHSQRSDEDRSAVTILETFLRANGKISTNFSKEDITHVSDETIKIQVRCEFEFNLKLSSLLKRNFLLSTTQLRRLFEQGVISLLSGKEPQKYKVKDGDILLMDKEHLLVMMDFVDSFMEKTGID